MPFVYTAFQTTSKSFQSPEFLKRNIEGLSTGQLDNIALIGIPGEKQIAYDGYISNLPAFLKATATRSRISTESMYHAASVPPDFLIPLPLPPLMVTSLKSLKRDEDKAAFRESLPGKVGMIRYLNMDVFTIEDITASNVASLPFSTINPNTPSSPDATSLIGLKSYLTTLKILTLFLTTHTYPAFSTPDGVYAFTPDTDMSFFGAKYNPRKGYRGNPSMYEARGMTREEFSSEIAMAVAGPPEGSSHYSAKNLVLVAKPAPLFPDINYGPPSRIPSLPGFILPYFNGLHDPSANVLIFTMKRFFIGAFGNSLESNGEGWREWLKGMRKWYKSAAGKMVTHIFFAMHTALECQAELFVIVAERKYLGCAILGYKFAIYRELDVLIPDTAAECRRLAMSLDQHTEALEIICGLLREMSLEEGEMETEENSLENIRTSRQLYKAINARKEIEGEDYRKLVAAISQLSFDERLWPMSLDKILLWIQTTCDETLPIPDEWPMYLSGDLIYDSSRQYQILSAFGPTAPSLLDSSGTEFPIPKGLAADDPASKMTDTGSRPLEAILVTSKKLLVAVRDAQNVFNKRRIRQNQAERAAGYRTIKFAGGGRNQIWAALKKLPFTETEKGKGKKRAREGDEEGSDDEDKAKRVRLTAAAKTFDILSF